MPKNQRPCALVVDDVADTADSLGVLLRLWGYKVNVCYRGTEALDIARNCPPDVVLLDIGMPGMDGFQIASCIQRLPGLADTLIIGISGHADEASRARAMSAGFRYYLIKPEDPIHLKALLARNFGETNLRSGRITHNTATLGTVHSRRSSRTAHIRSLRGYWVHRINGCARLAWIDNPATNREDSACWF